MVGEGGSPSGEALGGERERIGERGIDREQAVVCTPKGHRLVEAVEHGGEVLDGEAGLGRGLPRSSRPIGQHVQLARHTARQGAEGHHAVGVESKRSDVDQAQRSQRRPTAGFQHDPRKATDQPFTHQRMLGKVRVLGGIRKEEDRAGGIVQQRRGQPPMPGRLAALDKSIGARPCYRKQRLVGFGVERAQHGIHPELDRSLVKAALQARRDRAPCGANQAFSALRPSASPFRRCRGFPSGVSRQRAAHGRTKLGCSELRRMHAHDVQRPSSRRRAFPQRAGCAYDDDRRATRAIPDGSEQHEAIQFGIRELHDGQRGEAADFHDRERTFAILCGCCFQAFLGGRGFQQRRPAENGGYDEGVHLAHLSVPNAPWVTTRVRAL